MGKWLAILLAAATSLAAADWETDWAKARQRARDERRPILLQLTGSDWCSWCIKLKERVLDRPEFLDYARKHLVLMEADFPRRTQLPPETAEQNRRLRKLYLNRGYPTVYLLDADGNKLSEDLGEMPGGLAEWIARLDALLAGADPP